jgi:hypothetical protein
VKPRRTLAAAVAGLLLAVAVIAPASSSALVVGVGDQSPNLFTNDYLPPLGSERTRVIVAYDVALHRDQKAGLDAWVKAAQAAHQEIVVAFNPPSTMTCPNLNGSKSCRPVSSAAYTKAFKAFRKAYPRIRIFQPWNEVNNLTQPTVHRPDAVVTYYDIVRRNCRGCTVLGADIQDLPNMVTYTRSLLANFRRRKIPTPKVWGMHNYTDANRFVKDANSSVRKFLRIVPGKVWLTETGGLYRFQPQNARQTFRPDLKRQARAMDAVFKQAIKYRSRIDRVYLYHWFGAGITNRWDSGVLDINGQPRPAYDVLLKYKRYFG